MELVYLYIKKFKNIEDKEYNFSPSVQGAYDKKKNLISITNKNNNLGNDFFGKKIKNITAILGKNGSGKTNLIEAILIALERATTNEVGEMVAICKMSDARLVKFFTNFHCGIDSQVITYETFAETVEGYNLGDEKSTHKVIYYSSIFDGSDIALNKSRYFSDLSTNRLARDATSPNAYVGDELIRMINFLSSDFDLIEDKFNYPDKIKLSVAPVKIKDEIISKYPASMYSDFVALLVDEIEQESEEKATRIKALLLSVVVSYERSSPIYILEDQKKELIEKYMQTNQLKLLIELIALIIISDPFHKSRYDTKQIIEDLQNLYDLKSESDLKTKVEALNDLKSAIGFIANLNLKFYPFKYLWYYQEQPARISTGEKVFLSLFSRLFENLENSDNDRLITIILDEPDLGLHPEWQKKFLNYFINYIENDKCKYNSTQIIITSHSPFITSDLPKENIIYLGGTSKNQTFAANIHMLLADSFYMEDGLIGEFARTKIMEVVKHLESNKKEHTNLTKEYIFEIINMIGEPTVKARLLDEYFMVYNIQGDVRIALLEKEIEKIKREKRD